MFDEIKIFASEGELGKKLTELSTSYKNFIFIKTINNIYYFVAERTLGENFTSLYQSVDNKLSI